MAFSWNPFSRKNNTDQTVDSTVYKNTNFDVFSHIDNSIERAVMSKSILNQNIASEQTISNPVWQTFNEDGMLAMPVATNKSERIA